MCTSNYSKKTLLYILCIFMLLAFMTSCKSNRSKAEFPTAKDGILDLTKWDFDEDGPVNLNGEWEFYWEQLHDPSSFHDSSNTGERRLISIPSSWNGYIIDGAPLKGMGYATFRLRIQLLEDGKPKALKLSTISTSHKLWANGELVSLDGQVSSTIENSEPKYYSKVVSLKQNGEYLELIVQVSNFMHRRGGIWQPIKFGNSVDIFKLRERQLLSDMILFGSLFIMGLYHLVLHALRPKDKSPLYFGLFCLLISLRNILVGEIVLLYFFPQITQEFILKVEYLTFYLGITFFSLFIHSLFLKEVPAIVSRLITAAGIVYSAIVLVTKAQFYSNILIDCPTKS